MRPGSRSSCRSWCGSTSPRSPTTIGDQFGLTKEQIVTLGLVNVALTVPARILIGMALDHWGPRRVFSSILIYAGACPALVFATAQSFTMLVVSRLLLSVVGAGFVVGIRMVSEWFPPKEVGTAEGIYGGWGNLGAAFAAFALPHRGRDLGRRRRLALGDRDHGCRRGRLRVRVPAARHGHARRRDLRTAQAKGCAGGDSRWAVFALIALIVPMYGVLGLIAWRISRSTYLNAGGLVAASSPCVAAGAPGRPGVAGQRPALANDVPADDRYPSGRWRSSPPRYFCCFGW